MKRSAIIFIMAVVGIYGACSFIVQPMQKFDDSIWPSIEKGTLSDPKQEAEISQLLLQMSLEQKVAQMIQAEIKSITPAEVAQYQIGAVLNEGGSIAGKDGKSYATAKEWVALAEQYYQASIKKIDGRPSIPILWATDSVHGASNIIGATIFPHNIGLGATRNPKLLEEIGSITANETLVSGVDWILAPTVAVSRDYRWGRTYESYSEDPALVSHLATSLIKGIQGEVADANFLGQDKLLATAKHFIGDGGTKDGIDRGDNVSSEIALRDTDAKPYFSALENGVQIIMASFNSWRGTKVHGSHYLLTEVLKGKLGFDGFVVGDWDAHAEVEGCTVSSCAAAINAGIDMVMLSKQWRDFYLNTVTQVRSGEIKIERINDAVSRILRVKLRAGLFSKQAPSQRKRSADLSLLGSARHREVARQAVRESLVLLKNKNNVLPLVPKSKILVVGEAADDIGQAAGGWSVEWQGVTNANEKFPGGTSIFQALRSAVEEAGGQINFSLDGNSDFAPNIVIAVYGEKPYAEREGYCKDLIYRSEPSALQLLEQFKSRNIPVVSIFISGRPLLVTRELDLSDAFVVAWLPGTEGGGIADVILAQHDGAVRYDFKGKLPFSWPEPSESAGPQLEGKSALLFPYGFGLSYSKSGGLPDAIH